MKACSERSEYACSYGNITSRGCRGFVRSDKPGGKDWLNPQSLENSLPSISSHTFYTALPERGESFALHLHGFWAPGKKPQQQPGREYSLPKRFSLGGYL